MSEKKVLEEVYKTLRVYLDKYEALNNIAVCEDLKTVLYFIEDSMRCKDLKEDKVEYLDEEEYISRLCGYKDFES